MPDRLSEGEAALIARAKRVLNNSVADLDQATVLRLQRTRMAVLPAGSSLRWRWVWTSGVTMAGIAALMVVLWTKQPVPDQHHAPLLEDMELMMSAENVELAQDLEFYHWLADADTTKG